MELDDLKIAWAQLGQRMEATEALVRRDYRERKLAGARRALRLLGWGQAVLAIVSILVVAVVAPFWIEHRRVPHFLAAGLALHIYGVATIWVSVMQLLLIGRTYYTEPVVTFQRRLAELKRFRIVSTLALGLPWWMLWVPATMVGAQRFLHVDLYAESPSWLLASLALGAGGMALTVWVARRFADRPPASLTLRRMADDLAGRTLRRAVRQLDELARFEGE